MSARYDAAAITVLQGLEAVRMRPAMYVGSTGPAGLHNLVLEVVQNAVDEALAGHCARIEVTLHPDGSCSVADDGRGIPVDPHPGSGLPACEVVLTTLHSGGKFHDAVYEAPGGLHGVGLAAVNALSDWLILDVWRDGAHHRQRYARGVPGPLERVAESDRHGTRIQFHPDAGIFSGSLDAAALRVHLQAQAFLQPGLGVRFGDEEFRYATGLAGFVQWLNQGRSPVHADPIEVSGERDGVEVRAALQWTRRFAEDLRGYVNRIVTPQGGTHLEGLKAALTRVINEAAAELGRQPERSGGGMSREAGGNEGVRTALPPLSELGRQPVRSGAGVSREAGATEGVRSALPPLSERVPGESIAGYDAREGLTAVLSVRLRNPEFEGQTKAALTSAHVEAAVEGVVRDQLAAWLAAHPEEAAALVGRALEASRARDASRRASERARYQRADQLVSREAYRQQFGIRSANWHESARWITDDALLSRHASLTAVAPDALVLDACCGSGVVGHAFRGRVGRVVGLDLTPEMVSLARTRLDEVVQGDVYQIPFPDAHFDLVVNREVLHLLPHPERPVAEIFRVLKPGGQLIVGQMLPFGPVDAPFLFRVLKKKQPLFFNHFLEEDFRTLLAGAGFTRVSMEEVLQWEDIDLWIDTWETSSLHRHEIRDLYHHAPAEVRAVHPFRISAAGAIEDCWRWGVFSAFKPG